MVLYCERAVMVHDRESAGQKLAERLGAYREDPSGLILAFPEAAINFPEQGGREGIVMLPEKALDA